MTPPPSLSRLTDSGVWRMKRRVEVMEDPCPDGTDFFEPQRLFF